MFVFLSSFPSLTCIQTSMFSSNKTFLVYFVADVVPVLSERVGLPPGTPVKMFEVRMNAVIAPNPFCLNFFPELTSAIDLQEVKTTYVEEIKDLNISFEKVCVGTL